MNLTINRLEATDALAAICSVAATRTPKDILKCVHLEAQSDVLLLSATDLELGLRVAVTQVEVTEPGSCLVTADTLNRIVRECGDDSLQLRTAGAGLQIDGSGSHFEVVTQTAADFPPVPGMEGEPDFTLEHSVFRRLTEWTVFASARERTRYAINGVLWDIEDGRLTLVATDGRRLSVARSDLSSVSPEFKGKAIVPSKAMNLVARLAVEADATVAGKLTSNQLLLRAGGALISTALVEGQFPKYQDVVPTDCDRVIEMDTEAFHSALRRASLLTNEESKGVRFSFTADHLTLASRAPEQGEATISLPVRYQGEPVEIGFNPVFFTDVLRVTPDERIKLAVKEANRPGLVRLNDDFLHVIMPVNLKSA